MLIVKWPIPVIVKLADYRLIIGVPVSISVVLCFMLF